MNSPSSRRKRQMNRPLHPPLLNPELFEMVFPAFERVCGHGLRDIAVGGEVPSLIKIFTSGKDHDHDRAHRTILSGTSGKIPAGFPAVVRPGSPSGVLGNTRLTATSRRPMPHAPAR